MIELDGLYAAHPSTIAASKLLTDLPAEVPDDPWTAATPAADAKSAA